MNRITAWNYWHWWENNWGNWFQLLWLAYFEIAIRLSVFHIFPYHRTDNLQSALYTNLTVIQIQKLCKPLPWRETEIQTCRELNHGFFSLFSNFELLETLLVWLMTQIRFNSFSLCLETTHHFKLNSSLTKWAIQLNSWILTMLRDSVQLNSKLGNRIWMDLRIWIGLYRTDVMSPKIRK